MPRNPLPLLTAAIPDPFAFCAAGFGLWLLIGRMAGTSDELLQDAGDQEANRKSKSTGTHEERN